MTSTEARFARRWAVRRIANGLDPVPAEHNLDEQVVLSAAMQLLSDYEDAVYASCRHALVPNVQDPGAESAHLVEAVRLHADVRRLRLEVLDLIQDAHESEEGS